MTRFISSIVSINVFCFSIFIILMSSFTLQFASAKRLRLPMLLRSRDYECNLSTEICLISLNGFVFQRNATLFLAGRRNFYHFEINDYGLPRPQKARFNAFYFKATTNNSNVKKPISGCLHVDYLVRGNDKFLFVILQQSSESSLPHVVFSQQIGQQSNWNTVNVDVNIFDPSLLTSTTLSSDKQWMFIFEVICQSSSCSKGSTFSISRIDLKWTKCHT